MAKPPVQPNPNLRGASSSNPITDLISRLPHGGQKPPNPRLVATQSALGTPVAGTGPAPAVSPGAADAAVKARAGIGQSKAASKTGTNVTSMQQFLAKKGYNIAVDGVNGPLTQAAAADFRGSRNPHAFNIGHGLVHDQAPAATDASSSGSVPAPAASPTAPPAARTLGQVAKNGFYTTQAQAQSVLPPDVPGATVKFAKGKGYYIGTQTAASAAAANPGTARATTSAAAPTLQQQATQIVQSEIDPILKQIQQIEQGRAASGQAAITGYTQAEQQLLNNEPGLAAAAYGGAMQGQNAIDSAIASTLQGTGDANAASLGSKLAAISADPGTAARINGQTAADTTGNVGAQYASHSATLSALNQEGQAAQGYLRAQPGIAGLAGLQASKGLQGQVNQDLHTQLGNVTDQVPTMVNSVLSALTTAQTEQQKAQIAAAISAGYNPQTGQLTPAARSTLANALGYDPVTGAPTARTAIGAKNARTAAAKAGAPSAALSGKVGYLVGADGKPKLGKRGNLQILPGFTVGPNDSIVKVQKPTAQKGQLSDAAISKMITGWHDGGTKTIRVPVVDSNNKPVTNNNGVPQTMAQTVSVGTMGYQQAYKQLRAFGVQDQKARTLLDTKYQRGDQGRAWLTNEEQATLAKAGVSAKTLTVQGHHGILRAPQVKALKAAGKLPAGQETSDGFYVIAQTF